MLLSVALTDVLGASVLAPTSLLTVAFLEALVVVVATDLLDATSALGAAVLATTLLLAVEFLEASAVVLATDLLDAMSVLGAAVLATALLLAVAFWEASAVVLAPALLDATSCDAVLLAVPLEAVSLLPSPEVVLPSPAALVSFAGFSVADVEGSGCSTMRMAGRVLVKVMLVVVITVVIVAVVVATLDVLAAGVVLLVDCFDVIDTLSDGGTKGHATPCALQHHFFCSPVQLISAFSNSLQSKHPTFSLRQHHDFFGADHSLTQLSFCSPHLKQAMSSFAQQKSFFDCDQPRTKLRMPAWQSKHPLCSCLQHHTFFDADHSFSQLSKPALQSNLIAAHPRSNCWQHHSFCSFVQVYLSVLQSKSSCDCTAASKGSSRDTRPRAMDANWRCTVWEGLGI